MAIIWDKALYDAAYESRGGKHFDRSALFPVFERRAIGLIRVLGLSAAHRVLIVGAGFGWTCEALLAQGVGECVGTDVSSWIQSAKDTDPEWSSSAVVLDEDSATEGSRNQVRKAFVSGSDPTHVITEDILTSFSDAELARLADLDGFTGAAVAHIVTPLEPEYAAQAQADWPLWNWKTRADWRAFFDSIGLGHHRLFEPSDALGEF